MATDILTLRKANWAEVEREVIEKLRLLQAACDRLEPNPLNDRIANDCFLPAIRKLGEFCGMVTIEE